MLRVLVLVLMVEPLSDLPQYVPHECKLDEFSDRPSRTDSQAA